MEDVKPKSDKITFAFWKHHISDLCKGDLKYRGLLVKMSHREAVFPRER